ncbi:MAG: AI-2E family transporter, partial [Oscillospiraceae bacterium]|nr:AI-2E family transporter [Oscillospiraceae bacterium]
MKRFHWDRQHLYWGLTAFLVIAASLLFYLILSNLGPLGEALGRLLEILSPFIWGLVFAYLL